MSEPIIRLRDVNLRYHAGVDILRDVDLTIMPASFHFLTGASGAGKTSLLKLLYMDLAVTKGEAWLCGENIGHPSAKIKADLRRRMGIVFQDYRLLPHLNAFENVALPLRLQKMSGEEVYTLVLDIIKWVGLKDKLQCYPRDLSGGECQRLAFARAVIGKPEILLADEPTGNVDDATALRLIYLFREMHKRGTTVLFATHNYKLVKSYDYPVLHIGKEKVNYFAEPEHINYKEFELFN